MLKTFGIILGLGLVVGIHYLFALAGHPQGVWLMGILGLM